jgi:hypothetical protein
MLGLDPIANVTSRDMPGNICLHVLPPELFLQISIHFGASWMDTILGVMTLFQDFSLQGEIGWYTDSTLVPVYSLRIFPKLGALALLHELSDLPNFRTLKLGIMDPLFEVVLYLKLVQHTL